MVSLHSLNVLDKKESKNAMHKGTVQSVVDVLAVFLKISKWSQPSSSCLQLREMQSTTRARD